MMKQLFAAVVIGILALPFASVQAQSITGLIPCTKANSKDDPVQEGVSGLNCNSWQDVVGVVQFFINYAFVFATILAVISFAVAGWLYLTSNGNPQQVQKAHKIFGKVIWGFIIIALAYLLVQFLLTQIAREGYNLLQ